MSSERKLSHRFEANHNGLNIDTRSVLQRRAALEGLLRDLRDQELRKIKALIREEATDDDQARGDELDLARRQEELEFNVSLLDRSELRLAEITSALIRLEQGTFGICGECEQQIAVVRLQSLPMAKYCLDCQRELEASDLQRRRSEKSVQRLNLFDSYRIEPTFREPAVEMSPPPPSPNRQPGRYRRRPNH